MDEREENLEPEQAGRWGTTDGPLADDTQGHAASHVQPRRPLDPDHAVDEEDKAPTEPDDLVRGWSYRDRKQDIEPVDWSEPLSGDVRTSETLEADVEAHIRQEAQSAGEDDAEEKPPTDPQDVARGWSDRNLKTAIVPVEW